MAATPRPRVLVTIPMFAEVLAHLTALSEAIENREQALLVTSPSPVLAD